MATLFPAISAYGFINSTSSGEGYFIEKTKASTFSKAVLLTQTLHKCQCNL